MISSYGNVKGIGFFYPEENAVLSGIAKVYGLAYTNDGWLEEDKGVGRVMVQLGDRPAVPARTYVKNKYWVKTFDTGDFSDGPLEVQVTAYDMDGRLIGTAANTVIIDSSRSPVRRRLFASPDGKPENNGTLNSPWDMDTCLNRVEPGDIIYLLGGEYHDKWVVSRSGQKGLPITITNYRGQRVRLLGAGIAVLPDVEYVDIMGIDQSGLRFGASGVELGESVSHLQFWDCSFNDNTHPYEEIEPNEWMAYGVGFQALTVRGRKNCHGAPRAIEGQNRQFITVSHCEAKYNDVDGFDLSSIDHGRFQFLEAAWNPNHKTANVLQYKHADGLTIKNSEFEPWGFPSEDCVFLFCYSHHNGQDGFDLRSPHIYLFGCISHDEAQSGTPYGASGIKTWEYDYKFYNCLSFRNNIVDDSGYGLEAGNNSFLCNCLFYNTNSAAVTRPDDDPRVQRIFSHNNVFVDCGIGFTYPVRSYDSVYFGKCDEETLIGAREADPLLTDAENGNFFLAPDSPLLQAGCMKGFSFMVDGINYMALDGLGRPRASMNEIGPYTRYPQR